MYNYISSVSSGTLGNNRFRAIGVCKRPSTSEKRRKDVSQRLASSFCSARLGVDDAARLHLNSLRLRSLHSFHFRDANHFNRLQKMAAFKARVNFDPKPILKPSALCERIEKM